LLNAEIATNGRTYWIVNSESDREGATELAKVSINDDHTYAVVTWKSATE
jgi:hypothetical protein